jgi:hypothetical protein
MVFIVVVFVVSTKSPYLKIQAPEQLVSTTNQTNFGEKLASVYAAFKLMAMVHKRHK